MKPPVAQGVRENERRIGKERVRVCVPEESYSAGNILSDNLQLSVDHIIRTTTTGPAIVIAFAVASSLI